MQLVDIGANLTHAAFQQDLPEVVERARNDFTLRLRNCVLSVSQAGYNTVVETLQAGARAVLVPYAGGGESEQTSRARLLAGRGLVQVVEENALAPQALAAAIDPIRDDVHQVQPGAISITNATEYGLAYRAEEVRALGETARSLGVGFHMDGARFANEIVKVLEDFQAMFLGL